MALKEWSIEDDDGECCSKEWSAEDSHSASSQGSHLRGLDGFVDLDEVDPDDSASALGGANAALTRTDKRRTLSRPRELTALRRLVEGDQRFGIVLEKAAHDVHDAVVTSNPEPVLSLLAALVWRSLCIAWEIERGAHQPKARLRAKIVLLRDAMKNMKAEFEMARMQFLKELVILRDQVRRYDGHTSAAVFNVVYEEEPVMYYEPLKYLSEPLQKHIAEIVEEKLKLLVRRLRQPRTGSDEVDEWASAIDKKSAQTAEALRIAKRAADQYRQRLKNCEKELSENEAKLRVQLDHKAKCIVELQTTLRKYEAEVASLTLAAQTELADLETFARKQRLAVPQFNSEASCESESLASFEGDSFDRQFALRDRGRGSKMSVASESMRDFTSSTGTFDFGKSIAKHLSALRDVMERKSILRRSMCVELETKLKTVVDLEGVVETFDLGRCRTAINPLAGKKLEAEVAEMTEAVASAEARVKAAEASLRQQQDATELMKQQWLQQLGKVQCDLATAEQKAGAEAASAEYLRTASEVAKAEVQSVRRLYDESLADLATARLEILRLEKELEETKRELTESLDKLAGKGVAQETAQKPRQSVKKPKLPPSDVLSWRLPSGPVFERLYKDSINRIGRHKQLGASNVATAENMEMVLQLSASSGEDIEVGPRKSRLSMNAFANTPQTSFTLAHVAGSIAPAPLALQASSDNNTRNKTIGLTGKLAGVVGAAAIIAAGRQLEQGFWPCNLNNGGHDASSGPTLLHSGTDGVADVSASSALVGSPEPSSIALKAASAVMADARNQLSSPSLSPGQVSPAPLTLTLPTDVGKQVLPSRGELVLERGAGGVWSCRVERQSRDEKHLSLGNRLQKPRASSAKVHSSTLAGLSISADQPIQIRPRSAFSAKIFEEAARRPRPTLGELVLPAGLLRGASDAALARRAQVMLDGAHLRASSDSSRLLSRPASTPSSSSGRPRILLGAVAVGVSKSKGPQQ